MIIFYAISHQMTHHFSTYHVLASALSHKNRTSD